MTLEGLSNLKSSNKYVVQDKVLHQQVVSNMTYFEMCELLEWQSLAEHLDAMLLVKSFIRANNLIDNNEELKEFYRLVKEYNPKDKERLYELYLFFICEDSDCENDTKVIHDYIINNNIGESEFIEEFKRDIWELDGANISWYIDSRKLRKGERSERNRGNYYVD